ncbi:hypothetical protein GCM10023185_09080 [Hymenobacter saemangeumensis]|uniref:CBM-cenC domain-containing protein n=2 Tax=Hymenobacter saemangeumensis TaxID=1084522 RepID=A0ABP8I4J0_9BACT
MSLGLGACSTDSSSDMPTGMITRNDFENTQGWGGANEPTVTTEKAHSGKYSITVNPQYEFSHTYIRTLGQMTGGKPKKMTVTAWAWVPDKESTAVIVVDIKHSPENGAQVFYETLDLVPAVQEFKAWRKVSKTFNLPDSIASTNQCKVYLWRGSSPRPVFVDDVSIEVEN